MIFKTIEDFPNYEVDTQGRVRNKKSGLFINQKLSNKGYLVCNLWKNNKYKTKLIHRLIALYFLNNPKNLKQINHINGVKTDNRLENLEWTNQKENVNHALSTGLTSLGEERKSSKLTNKEALEIYNLSTSKQMKCKDIAKLFNVSITQVYQIKNKREWKHIHNT